LRSTSGLCTIRYFIVTLGGVEAENFVLNIGHLQGAKGASGATGYEGPMVLWPVLFLGKENLDDDDEEEE
jgi:hypothetical protein